MRQKEEHKLEGNGGGVSGHPYVSIDNEDAGSRSPWITFTVVAAVAVLVAVVALLLVL